MQPVKKKQLRLCFLFLSAEVISCLFVVVVFAKKQSKCLCEIKKQSGEMYKNFLNILLRTPFVPNVDLSSDRHSE